MFSNFFFSEILAVYEIMWKNVVEPDTPMWPYNTAHVVCVLDY